MSYLLEILGRGLVSSLRGALQTKLPPVDDLSLPELRSRLAAEPANEKHTLMLGLKLLWEDRFMNAGESFEQVLERDDESIVGLLGMASVHDELGRTEQALTLLNRARLIDVLDPVILFCIGFCCEKLNRTGEAVDAYRASLRACPDLRNCHERLAAIFLRQDKPRSALSHYEQLIEFDPDHMSDHITLANLYLKVGDPESAIRRYEMAIALDPDNWEIQEDLATAYQKAGLVREAIEMLHQMIDQQPEFADNFLRLGDLYAEAGDDPAAQAQYERALEISGEYLEAMVKLGTTLLRQGDHVAAAQWFNKAIEINDRLLTACVGLGVAQLQAGRHEEGMTSFELASQIEPNSSLLFSETARVQLKASIGDQIDRYLGTSAIAETLDGKREMATLLIDKQIERHEKAVREKPTHADMHYRLGLLLRHRGRDREAIEAFGSAVKINPVYEKALVKLGISLRAVGEIDRAIRYFRQALEVNPDDVRLHYQLGLIFAEKHLFDLAVDHFEKAEIGMSDNPDVQANLALALQNAGLTDRAETSWQTTVEMDAEPFTPDINLN